MTITEAIIQGIIQGLTEFLPVSSSGHLSIYQYFTGLGGEMGAFFSIALHVGTLLAVFLAFYRTILDLVVEFFAMVGDIFTGRFSFRRMNPSRRMILMLLLSLLPLAAVFFLKDWFESFSADNDIVVEGVCLILTGILLFLAEHVSRGRKTAANMTSRDALAVGVAQAIAPLPGLSRSGTTISTGMLMGLSKEYAVTFSFIMGIPAVLGATLLKVPTVLGEGLTIPMPVLAVGVITSAIFGLLAIVLVKKLVIGGKFIIFSYYTLTVGVLVAGAGIYEMFSDHALQRLVISLLA